MAMLKRITLLLLCLLTFIASFAEDGYQLWLRYERIADTKLHQQYTQLLKRVVIPERTATTEVLREELKMALPSLLGKPAQFNNEVTTGSLVIASKGSSLLSSLSVQEKLKNIHADGYLILTTTLQGKKITLITAHHDTGLLYGTFHFLRLLQTHQNIKAITFSSSPKTNIRILNHWDNLDRTVERGYAGFSIWDWHKLPDYIDQRYIDYARANASIGINATVLTNVNANALVLTPHYLQKVKALADVFRPYGIKVYLTARFSAPVEIGNLRTADPLDPSVQQWWKDKAKEIYSLVPDFGGFLVKANSEGQPGPQNYNRTHADGANMLADAVAPFNGIVMWRAFVYDHNVPDDRAKQAYSEFKPLDGTFRKNVMVQVKNGAIDFQPREPFHPLFGAMPKTPLMMEFQITQEYLGQGTSLVFLPSFYKEVLNAQTFSTASNPQVSQIIDGSADQHTLTGMAGVANIGNDRNWCSHPFAQANWYGFGRLAWDHTLTPEQIADEWTRMTFSNEEATIPVIKKMLLSSHETMVNYMTPLGLHHIMGYNHHYGPGPWVKDKERADWTSVYYHRADNIGIGFNRTTTGSNALSQYATSLQEQLGNTNTCDEKYLLWFHHLPWSYKTKSGKILWDEICYRYYQGTDQVKTMEEQWKTLSGKIDAERFKQVSSLLHIQYQEAVWWRNACVLYFQSHSQLPIPSDLEKPTNTLEYYQQLSFPYAPGIRPRW